jgi:hypothetical protein
VHSKTVLVRCDARSAQPGAPRPLHHARRRISSRLHNTDFGSPTISVTASVAYGVARSITWNAHRADTLAAGHCPY